jgi:CubicO group peptidase (beta-lactamase class C family)
MNRISIILLGGVFFCLLLSFIPVSAEDRPVSGKKSPAFEPIDKVILDFMDKIDCQAATVAISLNGLLVYSRGYGWSDEAKTKSVAPNALMRIASVTKPITSAAIKNAFRSRQLSLDTRAFDLIAVKSPDDKIADPRINSITVAQLLEHKGGWDREATFDPMFRTKQIEKELKLSDPVTPTNVIEFMLTKQLQFNPGEKSVYSNFGYCVLGRVLEKVMKKPYAECIHQSICRPLGIRDIKLGYGSVKKRDSREVWYPVDEDAFSLDIMDAHGGLIASAPALCQFLHSYWISGEPRLPGQREEWTFFGTLPGTTAMIRQRADGVNIAVLLNGRREKHYDSDDDSLKKAIDQAVEAIGKGK